MKTTICFIRHGQTNVNNIKRIQGRKDNLLNDTGREQAKTTAMFLKEKDPDWDIIYSSPLSRAYETATIIKDILNLNCDIIKDECFIERDFGAADGMPITDEIFKYILADDIEGLEKSYEIQKRVSDGVLKISKMYSGKKILVVAHSHTIKGLLTYVDKTKTFLEPLFNCSMSYFSVENNIITIEKVNINPKQ